MSISRFQFLRGDLNGSRVAIRPPWSLDETTFTEYCSRCGDCVKQCPENILEQGRGGFPQINFKGNGCTFCQVCVEVCKEQVFKQDLTELPWLLNVTIKSNCVSQHGTVCQVCAEQCETEAIRYRYVMGGSQIPELTPDLCTGCGYCYGTCPTNAIEIIQVEGNL
ncbi:MAG: ferredoxin-type protein NapF [Methylococcales bacterium]|jgi:ferredoxin-type protein NapF|nr:ferredoxin-type protein NapF [Methylococcales bacterium]